MPLNPQISEICRKIKITDYLSKRGVDVIKRGNRFCCKCPMPDHDDHDPSCYIRTMPDGAEVFKCFGCLHPKQEVLTVNGMVKSVEIKEGNRLIDVYGKEVLVKKVDIHQSKEPFVRLKTTIDNEGFVATADHDMLWLPKPVVNGKRISSRRRSDTIYEVEMRHLKKNDWVPVAIPKAGNTAPVIKLFLDKRTENNDGKYIEFQVNKSFAWFCGLYAAEGSISGERLISIDLHSNETTAIASLIDDALQVLSIKSVVQPIRDRGRNNLGQTITICHAGLARWLKQESGTGCENKKIPLSIKNGPLDIQASWALGVLNGDGNKSDYSISITSQNLRDELFVIGLMSGAIPSKRKIRLEEGKKPVFSMGFKHSSYSSLKHAAENNEFQPRIHKDACHVQIDGNWILAARIKSLKFFNYEDKLVVDITTDGTHTFSCLTIAVHNCGASGNIITLIARIDGESQKTTVKKISAQAGIVLANLEATARLEPLPDEIELIFCDEQDGATEIAQIAVAFMKQNPTEDVVNKISRMYEMIDKFTRLGDIEQITKYRNMLLETIDEYY